MWPFTKKKIIENIPFENKKEEVIPPRPKTRQIVSQIVLVNNRTDKPYFISAERDLGLTWDLIHGNVFCVNEIEPNEKVTCKGRFLNFSIVECTYKTVDNV